MLGRGFQVNFGFVFRVLRDLQIVQGDGAMVVQILGTLELSARQNLIGDGLAIVGKTAGHIVAANGQQQLSFLTVSPKRA